MNKNQFKNSVAYCGLVCGLCRPDGGCNCKNGNCGKRLSSESCYQYDCCIRKGIDGCWECDIAPCGIDMLAPEKLKLRAFVRCIKEDGIEKFTDYLIENENKGIVYHRNGVFGDYDLKTEDEVLKLLRDAK